MALSNEIPTVILVTEFAYSSSLANLFESGVSTSVVTGGDVLVTAFSGPPGAKGERGEQGPIGAVGPAGDPNKIDAPDFTLIFDNQLV
ncbi:collagen-like protein [Sphingomonas sp. WKB10]|nr:collagen-like protein [Sphingomonas sp. WKB10]